MGMIYSVGGSTVGEPSVYSDTVIIVVLCKIARGFSRTSIIEITICLLAFVSGNQRRIVVLSPVGHDSIISPNTPPFLLQ